MAQTPRLPELSACPTCAEPLEPGDLFCGGCGRDLTVAEQPAEPTPAAASGANGAAAADPGLPPGWFRDEAEGPEGRTAGAPDAVGGEADPRAGEATPPLASPPPPAQPPVRFDERAPGAAAATPTVPDHPETLADFTLGDPESDGFHLAAPESDPDHYRLAEPLGSETRADEFETEGPAQPPQGGDPRAAAAQSGDPRAALGTPDPAAAEAKTVEVKHCVACRTGTIDADGYCENCGHAQPRERDHVERELGGADAPAVAAVSDRGLRHHRNEDAFALSTADLPDGGSAVIAVVCDGVSSASRPDEASEAASIAARKSLGASLPLGMHPQQAMHEGLVAAAHAVSALAADTGGIAGAHQNAPACTIVSGVIANGILTVGWIGDSRAYWIPDDRTAPAARLTEDDSWAAQMVAANLMSEADAYADARAHAITGWLGADAHEIDPHTASFKPEGPGVVLVCTDGLWNYAEAAADMAAAVPADARTRPLHSAQVLVGHALDGGGHDNVTVAVLPFPSADVRARIPDMA
ncbi:protein phosphatase [Streptomyces sp. A7024]|uniref:Protein phosphatase n=1 Tax=Streptomyces coryli TaxID=1128680 RepID=A0A6G4UAD6_9ACTN|nr:protein phosphatase 2C domain-containing protein [Streptomyces coryli]NGN68151.1 protein phosphatase [Streptomyces coryli]